MQHAAAVWVKPPATWLQLCRRRLGLTWLGYSVKRQLIVAFVVVYAALISLLMGGLFSREQGLLMQRQSMVATGLSSTLALGSSNGLLTKDIAGLQELVEAQRAHPDLEFAMLTDTRGLVLAHTEPRYVGQAVLDMPMLPVQKLLTNQASLVDVVTPSFIGTVHVGWSRVGLSQRTFKQQQAEVVRDVLLYGGLAMIVGALVALLVGQRLTANILAIQKVVEQVEQGNDDIRAPTQNPDEVGRLARYFNLMLDRLSERTTALKLSEGYNKALFAESRIAKVVMDIDTYKFIDCNEAACSVYRLPSREAVLGLTPVDVSDATQYDGSPSIDAARAHIDMALNHGNHVFEWRHRRPDGELWDAEVHLMLVSTQRGPLLHFTLNDITERKQADQRIEQLAYFDPLTKLPNRRLMLDRLGQAMLGSSRSGKHCALMLIDLDNFKALNDTQGHGVGDKLLIEVGHRLEQLLPEGDTIARLGGDEFVLILRGLSVDFHAAMEVERFAEQLRTSLAHPYALTNVDEQTAPYRPYVCTASIGIALFQGGDVSADELMRHADTAMYKAKEAGRNAFRFFDLDMQASVLARVALEAELRHAVEMQQFMLHFQPQVNSQGQVVGVEALLRWQHPANGLVSPAQFIPLAEETGLIVPMGHWVLAQACSQLARWSRDPSTACLSLAVNVSAQQFAMPNFEADVRELLQRTGANPRRLKIELTESVVIAHTEDNLSKIRAIKAMGVTFAMDDFGTGYSSLSYLKRLPLDQLKIDRSFVSGVELDASDAAIARTIIALGQSLGMDVVAEGVETETQREFLEQIGCRIYQGYLFARPMPLKAFHDWLECRSKKSAAGDLYDRDWPSVDHR